MEEIPKTTSLKYSSLELKFYNIWNRQWKNLIILEREVKFIPTRRFRFDFVHRPSKTAIEIQGRGKHGTFKGLDIDYTKLNLAIVNGWTVFQLSNPMINHSWIEQIGNYIISQQEKCDNCDDVT
jgi:very-short-patch-repair endonuclease